MGVKNKISMSMRSQTEATLMSRMLVSMFTDIVMEFYREGTCAVALNDDAGSWDTKSSLVHASSQLTLLLILVSSLPYLEAHNTL